MKFGIMAMPQHPMADSAVGRFRETVELTRLARDVGFDAICCGHHFLSSPYQNLQHLPLLARLAADSGDMTLILAIVLLALLNPVEVAENVATLDVISDGRAVFGIGLGYRDIEYQAFNVSTRDRVPRMNESLELIKRLWTEERVTFHGNFFRLDDAQCTIRSVQRPHVPIWVAANSDDAVRRAGAQGYPWLMNPHVTLPTLERQAKIYDGGSSDAGQALPEIRPIVKELYIAQTREEALKIAQPYLKAKYAQYAEWGQDRVLPGNQSFRIPFEALAAEGRFMIGTPDDIVQQVRLHEERLGANYFLFRVWWPGMEARHAYWAVELLGKHVLPRLRDGSSA